MPHFPHTPEALLGRNDSKNAATTCKGITSTGRACRRALASPKASPTARRTSGASTLKGVLAVVQDGDDVQEADFYCWQHKDQAEPAVESKKKDSNVGPQARRRSTELPTLQERSSIDTLVQRLGIDAASEERKKAPKQRTSNPKPSRRTETNDFAGQQLPNSSAPYAEKYDFEPTARRKSKLKKPGFWASLCCMTGHDDDYVEIVRHRKRVDPEMSAATPTASHSASTRPSSNRQTNNLLSLIPQKLPPQTTSALLAELIKPISPYDEDGYIYIFWLTPSSTAPPGESTAKSILAPRETRPQSGRRISDVMTEYSFDENESSDGTHKGGKKTIMLKIGRANNITRRMNEWQRQCGYALNLVRWYPYVPSSTSPPPRHQKPQPLYPDLAKPPPSKARPATVRQDSETVHKCPHIHRVERLIHLELSSQQVKRQCGVCGKEHREWFEVAATQKGVKAVDETVRRWIGWAERAAKEG